MQRRTWRAVSLAACCGAVSFAGGYAGVKAGSAGNTAASSTGSTYVTLTGTTSTSSDTELSGTEVAAIISPSVVSITTEEVEMSQYWFGEQVSSGAGSGVIYSSDGYIITCAHVVESADTITVTTADGTEYDATLVGLDESNDIAVIKIDADNLTPATLGDSDTILAGETVYAVGNPGGTLSGTITEGIISAVSRTITVALDDYGTNTITLNVIQTSAAVSPGNSGGGLFDSSGCLIGIVNAKSTGSDEEGLGFAIPVNTAVQVAEQLIATGTSITLSDDTTTSSTEVTVTPDTGSGSGSYGYGGSMPASQGGMNTAPNQY